MSGRRMDPEDVDRRIDILERMGWCPLPFAHQPPPVKAAIHAARMRPQLKQCFRNAQMLMLMQEQVPLRYVEGVVVGLIPLKHAWNLLEDGTRVDITLPIDYEVAESYEVAREEVLARIIERETFGPIRDRQLEQTYFNVMIPPEVQEALRKNP